MANLLNNLNETISVYSAYVDKNSFLILSATIIGSAYVIFFLLPYVVIRVCNHVKISTIITTSIVVILLGLLMFNGLYNVFRYSYKADAIKFEQNCQKIADQYPNMIVLNSYDNNDLNILLTKKPLNQQKLNEYSNGIKITRSDSQIIIKISNKSNTQPNSYELSNYRNLKNQSTENLKKVYLKWF